MGKGQRERAEALLAEGNPYDALMEAGDDMEIGLQAYSILGGSAIRAHVKELEQKGTPPPEAYRALAEEAVRGDEMGKRVELAKELFTKARADVNEGLAGGGDMLTARYRETGRMRYFETAMKYYGAAGALAAGLALAREAVDRFRREGGAVFLYDALDGLRTELKLADEEIAAAIPLMGEWIAVQKVLEARKPFGLDYLWLSEPSAAYDAFLLGATGRSYGSFREELRGAAPRGLLGPKMPFGAKDTLRTWGLGVTGQALRERVPGKD